MKKNSKSWIKKFKKHKTHPRFISLFTGCGGLDLGFIMEGFEPVWANDLLDHACETYRNNIGNHIYEGDIADVDFSKIPDGELVLGGFPCQDFSMIWKRGGINTNRGNLYRYFVEVVKEKEPKAFVAENVKGLMSANDGEAIKQIAKDFSNINGGYRVYGDIYNFADYGVPQLRERVLLIGIRDDVIFKFKKPEPTHTEENYVTAGEALKGVEKVPYNQEQQNIYQSTVEKLKLIPEGGNYTDIPKDSPHYVKGMISHVYRRLHRNKPSTTLIANGGGGTWGYHYQEPRSLTNRERARIQTFPDDFIFSGKFSQIRTQIGNAVPPKGVRLVAQELMKIFTNDFQQVNDKEELNRGTWLYRNGDITKQASLGL